MNIRRFTLLTTIIASISFGVSAEEETGGEKEACRSTPYGIKAPEGYDHDLFAPDPHKRMFDGIGYLASIDDSDDDDGKPGSDYTASPEWVSYQLNGYYEGDYAPGWKRPSEWYRNDIFDIERRESDSGKRIDESYKGVGKLFNRGHLANRSDLNRISAQMGCNSHDPTNAVPQVAKFNQGIWLGLENYIASLSNIHGAVWISAGPIYEGKLRFIGDKGEVPVAIPSALWKTVAWIENDSLQWRAWIYPNKTADGKNLLYKSGNCGKDKKYRHDAFLVNLRTIEEKTGLTMFPAIKGELRDAMLDYVHQDMPAVPEDKFIGSCH